LLTDKLAGLHSNAYINDSFARAFAREGMKAYVELIQSKEREIDCDVLTHQKVCSLPACICVLTCYLFLSPSFQSPSLLLHS
jgi:hypothetical protein